MPRSGRGNKAGVALEIFNLLFWSVIERLLSFGRRQMGSKRNPRSSLKQKWRIEGVRRFDGCCSSTALPPYHPDGIGDDVDNDDEVGNETWLT